MISTEELEYGDAMMSFRGYIAYDAQSQGPKPCILIAHDWSGRSDAACAKARQLAAMGYVGFAIDMYGDAQLGHDQEECRALMTPLIQDRQQLAARILAAFNKACSLPQVDAKKIAAIGYCFGGMCVLDLARSGAIVRGVVSFHGLLSGTNTPSLEPITAKILVLHGYDDPLAPPDQITEFATEMTTKNVDWQVHIYGRTAHSFTNPDAKDPSMGLYYNKTADQRSWATMSSFLKEALG
jgi:dienelactone hydrolase